MSFKKNYFSLAILTIALIAILTACGSSAPAEESTQAVLGDPEKPYARIVDIMDNNRHVIEERFEGSGSGTAKIV